MASPTRQFDSLRQCAVLALVLSASACNCSTGVRSLTPKIVVTPAKLAFGSVPVGTIVSLPLQVTNQGQGALFIHSVTVADMDDVTVPTSELLVQDCEANHRNVANLMELQLNECARIIVRFSPQMMESINTYILIASNDPKTPVVKVPVSAAGVIMPFPQIEVCVLDPSGAVTTAGCTDFTASPPKIPSLDFGIVEYEQPTTRKIRIFNKGTSALSLNNLRLQSSTADLALMNVPTLPAMLAAGSSSDLEVVFTPKGTGAITGKLVILSNDTNHPEIDIPISGQEDGPCLQVMPSSIDFGTVEVGSSKQLSMSIENCGHSSYQITTLSFAPTNGSSQVFAVSSGDPGGMLPVTPFTFNPGDMHTLNLTYTPTMADPSGSPGDTGQFTVVTSYQETQVVPVVAHASAPMSVCGGTNTPVARIAVTQNGAAVAGNVLPLSTVQLSGAGSTATSGATITSYSWSLLSAPQNSTSSLQGSGASESLLCSLAGTYTVGLIVKDSNGCESAQATVAINVVPGSGLHVELTWPQNFGDLDLHYLGPGGSFFDAPVDQGGGSSDLFYVYAKQEFDGPGNPSPKLYPYGETGVDWGLNGTTQADHTSTDDPSLDADQLWGKGPENATQPAPFNGTYTLMVHYFCSSNYDESGGCNSPGATCVDQGAATAILTVYWNGSQVWQGQQSLRGHEVWTAGTINVTGNGPPTVNTSQSAVSKPTDIFGQSYGCQDGI